MTKSQLKEAYINWNIEIGNLNDRKTDIIHQLQEMCTAHNTDKSCCLVRLVESLVKEGLTFEALNLAEEYYNIDGQNEALRKLALATNNFDNAV